jgi:hypothetical protein
MKGETIEQCTQTNENEINLDALEDVKNNVIRKFIRFVYDTLSLKTVTEKTTKLYRAIHDCFIIVAGIIAIFNTSLFHLIILLIIISLDAFSIVVLHECPLTTMERKYLNVTSTDIRNEMLKKAGIVYHCGHDYEKQIELLINVWMLIAGKCFIILLLKTFHLKIFNYNNLYVL